MREAERSRQDEIYDVGQDDGWGGMRDEGSICIYG